MCAARFFDFYEQLHKPRGGPASGRGASPPAPGEPLTVSQLTGLIDAVLKDALPPSLLVRGEVSNFNHHRGSGHAYFTLKDPDACIDCVMFKSDFVRVKFTPADGMELLARGHVGVYAQRGRYQLYVNRLDPMGQGALELAFRQLCAKLEREGLFRPERKRPVPRFPLRIAIITSTQTAALQDMLKVLRRFSWLKLFVYHVAVQGDGAAEQIADAIAALGRMHRSVGGIDLILLGRGGGSLEDLWEFNEEVLARAIVASIIPILTGIGHEVDVTIADLAADQRAHTPTEAAQVAVANWRTARDVLDALSLRMRREMHMILRNARQRLAAAERHAVFRRPLDLIHAASQRLDEQQRRLLLAISSRVRNLRERLGALHRGIFRAAEQRLRHAHDRLNRLVAALRERHPRHAVQLGRQRLEQLSSRLHRAMAENCACRRRQVEGEWGRLRALGPQEVLNRGYTITTLKKTGAILRSARQAKTGERIMTRFSDGSTQSIVEDQRQLPLFG